MDFKLSRRSWLHAAGLGSLVTGAAAWSRMAFGQTPEIPHEGHSEHHGHLLGAVGRVAPIAVDPVRYLRSWNFNHLTPDEQAKFYRETPRPNGSMLREY